MNVMPHMQRLLMLVLGILLPEEELALGEREGRIGEATRDAIRRFLVEHAKTVPEGLEEQSPEWSKWLIHELEAARKPQYIVFGKILAGGELPLSNVRVEAFDRDLPSRERRFGAEPTKLGKATTDAKGRFQITYALDQFRAGDALSRSQALPERNADLSFRVFDRSDHDLLIRWIQTGDREYRANEIIRNAPTELEVTILVESQPAESESEYEQLIALIAPVVEGVSIAELTDEDMAFLIGEIAVEQQPETQQNLEWLRWSALLARETQLPIEAFYGWARTDLPDMWRDLHAFDDQERRDPQAARLLDHLVATAEETLIAHLLRAVEGRIIPSAIRDRAGDIAYAIRRRALKEVAVRLRLEREPGGEPLAGYLVTTLDAGANNRDLGTDVTDALGEFMVVYEVHVTAVDDEHDLRFRVRGPAIAEAVEVTRPVRADTSAATGVRVLLPEIDTTLQRLREHGHIDLPDQVFQSLMNKYHIRSLADIRRLGGLKRIAELRDLDLTVMSRLDAFADLDRLSEDLSEISALLDLQYDSVAAIADATRSEFVASMSTSEAGLSARRAAELHVAAQAQTEMLDLMFAGIALDFANGIRPSAGYMAGDYYPPFPEEQDHE